jgi:hypothetical protein
VAYSLEQKFDTNKLNKEVRPVMWSRLAKGLLGMQRWARRGFLVFFISSAAAQCPEMSGLKSDWCISKSKPTDFSAVTVQMQSGEKIPALDLPFFKLAINIVHGKWANRAATAEWLIMAPPANCPFSTSYRLTWSRPVVGDMQRTLRNCQLYVDKKVRAWPKEAQKQCECKLILDNMSNKDKSIWKSRDDAFLMTDEFKVSAVLSRGTGDETSVVFSLGSDKSGIYSVDGSRLCRYSGSRQLDDPAAGALAKINALLRTGDKPFDINCIGSGDGKLDISAIRFNVFNSKIEGVGRIYFPNGEVYSVTPD